MPTVTVGATEVAYTVESGSDSGPALVLVHGTGGSAATNFGHLAGQWGDRTVVSPDFTGSGETIDPGGPIELDDLAAQVIEVAKAAGVGSYHVAGFSLGAVVATAVAARDASNVRSLTAIAGWPSSDDARVQLQFTLWRDLIGQHPDLGAAFLVLTGLSPRFLAGLPHEQLQELVIGTRALLAPGTVRQAELDARIEIRDLATRVRVPALVIGLTQDQIVPVDDARELHKLIPDARYAEIDSGHLVVFEDPPARTATVTGFLDEVETSAPD